METRVLLIDDDDAFRSLLSLRLKSFLENSCITEFPRLADARAYFSEPCPQPFDLIFLDQHLPDGLGIELLEEGIFKGLAVLAVSSDASPEMPGRTVSAGAAYFLSKDQVRSPLFPHLVKGIIDRNKIQHRLLQMEVDQRVLDLAKAHIGTLKHEINNPLGAVLGAAFLVKNSPDATADQVQAADLVEKSGKRIKYVVDQICSALESGSKLQEVSKANQKVFHIPGDAPWEPEESS
ncbi:MAG: response regulator [Bdellovibrionales bacterium]|nr:response regulator [Bdellovibrionales bacterium]